MKVGIEDMKVFVSPYYVDAKELAELRAKEVEVSAETLIRKYKKLGIKSFSVFYDVDIIETASNLILELLERNNLSPKDISKMYTATESAIDNSKPLGTFILGELEKHGNFERWATRESKFACVAGSYDLWDAVNHVRLHPKEHVIVLCLDEALYEPGEPGEPTQGAGIIAMLVGSSNPAIELDFNNVGVCTRHTFDFYKPLNRKTPIVNGWESVYAYLYAMREAWDHFKARSQRPNLIREVNYLLLHNPYGLMVKDFMTYLFIHEMRAHQFFKELCRKIGSSEPVGSGVKAYLTEETRRKHAEFRKKIRETEEFKRFYAKKVGASVKASELMGNLYTGSLFLQLASLETFGKPKPEPGDEIIFFGFGSGSGSLVYNGIYRGPLKGVKSLKEELRNRKKLKISEYERFIKIKTGKIK
ncbi:hypothetical protein J7L36_00195 [bacterium]|nr:hypothetical protein [bacterium]